MARRGAGLLLRKDPLGEDVSWSYPNFLQGPTLAPGTQAGISQVDGGRFQIGNFFFALRGQEGHVPFTVVFFRARNISVADSRNQPATR